jgi:hypothetical protein
MAVRPKQEVADFMHCHIGKHLIQGGISTIGAIRNAVIENVCVMTELPIREYLGGAKICVATASVSSYEPGKYHKRQLGWGHALLARRADLDLRR